MLLRCFLLLQRLPTVRAPTASPRLWEFVRNALSERFALDMVPALTAWIDARKAAAAKVILTRRMPEAFWERLWEDLATFLPRRHLWEWRERLRRRIEGWIDAWNEPLRRQTRLVDFVAVERMTEDQRMELSEALQWHQAITSDSGVFSPDQVRCLATHRAERREHWGWALYDFEGRLESTRTIASLADLPRMSDILEGHRLQEWQAILLEQDAKNRARTVM